MSKNKFIYKFDISCCTFISMWVGTDINSQTMKEWDLILLLGYIIKGELKYIDYDIFNIKLLENIQNVRCQLYEYIIS